VLLGGTEPNNELPECLILQKKAKHAFASLRDVEKAAGKIIGRDKTLRSLSQQSHFPALYM